MPGEQHNSRWLQVPDDGFAVPLTALPVVNGPTNVSTSLPSSSLAVVALPLARVKTAPRSRMPCPLVASWALVLVIASF